MKKFLQKLLLASVAAGSLFFATVQAEIKTYPGTGSCVQSELVTAAQAKNYATERTKLDAKEKAGVYVSGYIKQNNSGITDNDVPLVTGSILNIVGEVKYSRETQVWGNMPLVKHIANLQANIDSDELDAYIKRRYNEKDGGAVSQIQSADKDIKDNLNRIDTLIERYNRATSQAEKDKIRAEFSQADRNVLAGQKIDEGNEFYNQGKYEKAIELYNETLQLNPNLDTAYNNRGVAYAD